MAREVTPRLATLAGQGDLRWLRRGFRRSDLRGAFLAICAERDDATRRRVARAARRRRTLVQCVDHAGLSDFIAGSVVRRGELTVAISTGGAAPALAVRLRQRIEGELGPEYGAFLELAAAERAGLLARCDDFDERRRRWYRAVDSDVLDLLRAGRPAHARTRLRRLLGP